MLHILWILLKIIAALLGIILGLLLLAVLLILFCPLAYRGRAACREKEVEAQGRISWLFCLVAFQMNYQNGNVTSHLKIFGIPAQQYEKFLRRFRRSGRKQDDLEEVSGKVSEEPLGELPKESSPGEPEIPKAFDAAGRIPLKERKTSAGNSVFFRLAERIKNVLEKLKKFPRRVSRKILGWKRRWDSIFRNIRRWMELLENERIQAAVRFLWENLKALLKHVAPKRLSGHVRFGTEDPSVTGAVLAGLGITCPIHKNRVEVIPVFDQAVLEGEVKASGRIYGVFFIKMLVSVYFNKDVKYMIKKWKQKEG